MDEPSQTHRRSRHRRVALTVSSVVTAVLALLLTSHPGRQLITTSTESVHGTVQSAQSAAQSGSQAVLNAQPGLWHVTRDIDGDTIDVQMGAQKERVRFLGIDTPETHDPRKPVQCFGLAAAAHTKQLLEGKNVRLEPDPINSDRDKYGRLLRYIYLPDGTLINAELVRDGYAFAYTVFPLTKLDQFQALETEARQANRGLWAGCRIDESQKIKQTVGTK